MTLHDGGLQCAACREQVVPDECAECGPMRAHGSELADPRDLPDHDCEEAA